MPHLSARSGATTRTRHATTWPYTQRQTYNLMVGQVWSFSSTTRNEEVLLKVSDRLYKCQLWQLSPHCAGKTGACISCFHRTASLSRCQKVVIRHLQVASFCGTEGKRTLFRSVWISRVWRISDAAHRACAGVLFLQNSCCGSGHRPFQCHGERGRGVAPPWLAVNEPSGWDRWQRTVDLQSCNCNAPPIVGRYKSKRTACHDWLCPSRCVYLLLTLHVPTAMPGEAVLSRYYGCYVVDPRLLQVWFFSTSVVTFVTHRVGFEVWKCKLATQLGRAGRAVTWSISTAAK